MGVFRPCRARFAGRTVEDTDDDGGGAGGNPRGMGGRGG